jgi:hypothetical protein
MRKNKIRHLINLEEEDGLEKTKARLNEKLNYLKSKNFKGESNQMKYIKFHLRKLRLLENG